MSFSTTLHAPIFRYTQTTVHVNVVQLVYCVCCALIADSTWAGSRGENRSNCRSGGSQWVWQKHCCPVNPATLRPQGRTGEGVTPTINSFLIYSTCTCTYSFNIIIQCSTCLAVSICIQCTTCTYSFNTCKLCRSQN